MLKDKVFVNLYIMSIDKNFEIFLPVNEKVGNILVLLKKSFGNLSNKNLVLLNLYSGNIYKNNDLIRDVDIKNGTRLMLI